MLGNGSHVLHPQARGVVDYVSQKIQSESKAAWRGDYFCCQSTPFPENRIPENYIKSAFESLNIKNAETDVHERGLCIYVPGGKEAMNANFSLHPILVYGRKSLDSGTRHQNI